MIQLTNTTLNQMKEYQKDSNTIQTYILHEYSFKVL